jgi:hypothetical protein
MASTKWAAWKWVAATCIKSFERDDGKAVVFILARDDGFYSFEAFHEVEDDEEGTFPVPSEVASGLYDSADFGRARRNRSCKLAPT